MRLLIVDLVLLGLSFTLSAVLTAVARRIAITDVPNERSSHQQPTPRTGGIAMVLSFFALLIPVYTVFSLGQPPATAMMVFVGLAALLWTVSLLDDKRGVAASQRLIVQLVAAGGFALLIGRIETVNLSPVSVIELGWFSYVLTMVWIIFFINAFNFMDGIDGIAAGTGLVACLFVVLVMPWGFGHASAVLLIGVLGGFLLFNFPRGRIFMGDSGSQVLGFIFAGLAVLLPAESGGAVPFEFLPLLFVSFIFDVAWTLIKRARRGEQLMSGHREHLYQLLIRSGYSHRAVAIGHFASVCLFGAAAVFVIRGQWPGWLWLLVGALLAHIVYAALVQKRARRFGLFDD